MASDSPLSVARTVTFRAFLASDGKTPATGKTIAITISKNGATSFSNPNAGATNATEMASGFYKVAFDTTDMGTAGPFSWRGAEGTINDVGDNFDVVDANRGKLSALPAATAEASGGLATLSAAQASNGTLPANVHRWLTATPSALISGRPDVSIGNVQNNVNGLIRSGTAQSVGANQIVIDSAADFLDNALIGATVVITNGTAIGSRSIVTANTQVGDILTLGNGWTGATPSGTPTFDLFASAAGGAAADSAGVTTLLARVGTPADFGGGATVAQNLSDIEGQTDDIGTAGAGLTAVGDTRLANLDATVSSRATPAQVNTEADTALADAGVTTVVTGRIDAAITTRATPAQVATELGTYDGPTNAELTTALAAADDAVLAAIAALNNLSSAQAQTAAAAALTAYDPPTNAEMEARTLTAALIAKLTAHLGGLATGLVGSGSTTTAVVFNAATGINAGAPSATNDFYNGRVIIFLTGTLALQATSISDYVGSTVTATVVALTSAPTAGDTFILV